MGRGTISHERSQPPVTAAVTLEELLKQATPLPWWEDSDHRISGGVADARETVCDPRCMAPMADSMHTMDANTALIIHAVNLLPRLVAALQMTITPMEDTMQNLCDADRDGLDQEEIDTLDASIQASRSLLAEVNNLP